MLACVYDFDERVDGLVDFSEFWGYECGLVLASGTRSVGRRAHLTTRTR